MKIAINTIPLLFPLTGIGNYIYHVARSLQKTGAGHEYNYFYGYYSRTLIPPGRNLKAAHRVKEFVRGLPLLGAMARDLQDLQGFISRRKFDLYFEPHFIPLHIPARRTVVTVPDFSLARFPEWHTSDKVRYFQKNFWKKINRADRVIFISHFIQKEAMDLFGFALDRSSVIHLGYDREVFRPYPVRELIPVQKQYDLPEKFILFVGSIEPRKNLKNVLRAYLNLEKALAGEYKLVLVGFKGWENKEVMGMIRMRGSDVRYLGYVPESDLGKIYNLARLFVFPSFYEGFGLPPLEAMACGCPVIVSKAASLPEVCGDAVCYVDPLEASSIAEGMERVLTEESLRTSLISKGLKRAGEFTWEKCARAHLAVFEDLCGP